MSNSRIQYLLSKNNIQSYPSSTRNIFFTRCKIRDQKFHQPILTLSYLSLIKHRSRPMSNYPHDTGYPINGFTFQYCYTIQRRMCELKIPSVPSTDTQSRIRHLSIIPGSTRFSLVSSIGMRGCPIPTGEHQQTYTRIYVVYTYVRYS